MSRKTATATTPSVSGARRRTQGERRSEAERSLLLAAARLIAEGGLARVSLARIGEAAGYSRGLVNHHFGSRAALIERLVELVQVEFSAATAPAARRPSAIDGLLELTHVFLRMLEERGSVHHAFLVLWADAVALSSEVRDSMASSDREFRAAVAGVVERGIASGEIARSVTPDSFAISHLGTLRGVALQVLIDSDGVDLARTRCEMERSLRASLQPTPDRGGRDGTSPKETSR